MQGHRSFFDDTFPMLFVQLFYGRSRVGLHNFILLSQMARHAYRGLRLGLPIFVKISRLRSAIASLEMDAERATEDERAV